MSKGPWRLCPVTGISLAKLSRVSDDIVRPDGTFATEILSDSNVFCVNSIAALCGYTDVAYFRDHVLEDPACPIHVHKLTLVDDFTGRRIGEVIATHQNSADFGGQVWHEMQQTAARERGVASQNCWISSGHVVG